jgi:hypothetical protein
MKNVRKLTLALAAIGLLAVGVSTAALANTNDNSDGCPKGTQIDLGVGSKTFGKCIK